MKITSRTSAVAPINYNYGSLNTVYLQIVQPIILKHLSCVASLESFVFSARFFVILPASIPDFLVIQHVMNLSIVHFEYRLATISKRAKYSTKSLL